MALTDKLTAIANAIRAKTGGSAPLTLPQMATEIGSLSAPFSVTNILTTAIDTDNSSFNGGLGYKSGYRLSASGAESAFADYSVSGYIPVSIGDVIRVVNIGDVTGYSIYMYAYNAAFAVSGGSLAALNPVTSGHGCQIISAKITGSSVKYIRFAFNSNMASNVIVTKNEKISPLEA